MKRILSLANNTTLKFPYLLFPCRTQSLLLRRRRRKK